jgi:hypothetical protein
MIRTRFLLVIGLALLVVLQGLHFADVVGLTAGSAVQPYSAIVRANITPLAWCAYLMAMLGVLTVLDGRSYVRRFRNRFLVCWLWAVPAWCYFDWMNFYFMRDPATGLRAWEYINLPPDLADRFLGYLIAFGAIAPGTAEVLQRWRFWKLSVIRPLENRNLQIENRIAAGVFLLGAALVPIPVFVGTPASNMAIWVGTWALLDPINRYFGRPSILADWFAGRFGRSVSLGLAGLLCGLLWEFWNYWSLTKWQYHLPFLGAWEKYKYFEMPVAGLMGFVAFGIETWAMWQTSLVVLSAFVEAEPGGSGQWSVASGQKGSQSAFGDRVHHDYACL